MRWSAAARFSAQIGTWAITLYVIRILSPEHYGLMSMASILMGFSMLVNELGVIPALIQRRDVNEYMIRQVFGFVLISNFLLFILLYLFAPYFSLFFEQSQLTLIVRVLSLSLLISALSAVPMALLQREIRFKGISVVEFVAMIFASLTTLLMATLGFGVWALVIGNISLITAKTVGILIVSRFRLLPVFRFHGLREIFVFGAKITGQRILWQVNSQVDVLLVGKLLGNQALGIYSVAFQLATLPMSKVMSIVNQVAFPAYSRLQQDAGLAAEYFLKSIRLACLIFFPLLWGFSSVSEEFVDAFLGHKWEDAKIVLRLITLTIPLRVMANLLAPLTDGLGHPGLGLRNLLTSTAIIPVAVLIGIQWGLVGICAGLIVAYSTALLINFRRSFRVLNIRPREFVNAVTPSAFSAGVMYLMVTIVGTYVVADASAISRLAILIMTGVMVYLALTFLFNRETVFRAYDLIRGST